MTWTLTAASPRPPAPPRHPGRLAGLLLVACAHIVLGWGLWALGTVPLVAAELRPLMVVLMAPPAPSDAPPHRPLLPPPQAPTRPPVPPLAPLVTPPPLPAPEAPAAITLPAAPAPASTAAPAPVPAASAAAPTAPPPPPLRRQLDASAVRYLAEPPAEVPRASRRAGEHGTVWLRVVVDVHGQPAQVQLHRSSGFARLDEQALWAMRQARFRPHTENGRAIEVEVIAPIEYPAE